MDSVKHLHHQCEYSRELFDLLSHREALLLAESELAGSYGSVDQWKTTLSDAERELLESYELSVQQAFDNIAFIVTGGLSETADQ